MTTAFLPITIPPPMPTRRPLTVVSNDAVPPEMPLYRGDITTDLRIVSRNRLAEQITGGLSRTTKLPCPSWGISASRCQMGSLLAQQHDSVCSQCYALKGRYLFSTVQAKLEQRYRGLFHELWTPAMIFLINYFCDQYFRWFDSGDLIDTHHLKNIVTVARHTPDVHHWLATREVDTVRSVQREGVDVPQNLVIRVSAHRIDGVPPQGFATTSTVITTVPRHGYTCPAPDQENTCGDCRESRQRIHSFGATKYKPITPPC